MKSEPKGDWDLESLPGVKLPVVGTDEPKTAEYQATEKISSTQSAENVHVGLRSGSESKIDLNDDSETEIEDEEYVGPDDPEDNFPELKKMIESHREALNNVPYPTE